MKTKVSTTAVADISSGPTLVRIDCGARVEICGVRKGLLARYQRLLLIFGQGLCWFGIYGSGSV